jgi:hypothetical protein
MVTVLPNAGEEGKIPDSLAEAIEGWDAIFFCVVCFYVDVCGLRRAAGVSAGVRWG